MMKAMSKSFLLLLGTLLCAASLQAAPQKGTFGVGINYPGLSARYFVSDAVSLELKGQSETDAMAAGLRGNYYFKSAPNFSLFTGLEADYLTFKGEVSEGTGFAVEPYIGGEYFFTKALSFQMDFGPALLLMQDKDVSDASVSGLEIVVNLGVNYYF